MSRGLLIAGSREVDPWVEPIVEQMLDFGLAWFEERMKFKFDHIIEGGAKGVDRIARRWAEQKGMVVQTVEADWERLGRAAGPIRNAKMATLASAAILVWDGKSRGTADMLSKIRAEPIPHVVYPLVRIPRQQVFHEVADPMDQWLAQGL